MRKVDITISVAEDGFYSVYCNDCPTLFGSGDTPDSAIEELKETLRLTKQDGRELAMYYPDWLDEEYEFVFHWNITDLMSYYAGVITPTALGRLADIHPKAAIHKRNRWMVDRSDVLLACVHRDFGGAYETVQYAMRKGVPVLNLAQQETLQL